ncbi:MAG: lipid-transfer protein [Actinomycetota bacterium]
MTFAGTTAIAGIGQTEFSKDSGRTELRLAVEAVQAALNDAGLEPKDVDGMVTFTLDRNDEIDVARNLGIPELTFYSRVPHGGGAAGGTIQQAAMAVATGVADVVVAYRAFNERSWYRYGRAVVREPAPTADMVHFSWILPFGLSTPASWVAMFARRYMHEFGATSEDLGRVTVADRTHAATNPAAFFYQRPITLEEHQASRWIVEPLRLLDCCQESDGAVAIVVTSLARARDLTHAPAVIRAVSQAAGHEQWSMNSYYRDVISDLPEMGIVARQLWAQSGLGPQDIQAAMLYDAFTPMVLVQLEEFGFCGRGEAKDFVADGGIEIGGNLAVNTNGGQLGEAYIHGMNGIAEAVRQVRGTAVNQIDGLEHALATGGTGVPTSAVLLGKD